MKKLLFILPLIILFQCKPKEDNSFINFPGKPEVPSSIKKTHEHLLERIHGMTLYKDSSSLIAIKIEDLMIHHFKEEEDLILPLLGLLPLLANEKIPEENKDIIFLSENVKTQIGHMSAEHQLIHAYIDELKQAANDENLHEILEFEKEVIHHATTEEEVFFPASIIIGEYLKLKTEGKQKENSSDFQFLF